MLRKYVAYAKKNIKPRLTADASTKIQNFYIELRKLGLRQGAVPITPRQIEGLVRLAEASAKTRLCDTVEFRDAEIAVGLFNYMLTTLAMDRGGRMDIDILTTGMPKEKIDKINSVMAIIRDLEAKEESAKIIRVLEEGEKAGFDKETVMKYVNELERTGDIYVPKPGIVKIVRHGAE